MNTLQEFLLTFAEWFSRPLFTIGQIDISLSRMSLALAMIVLTWVLSSRFERAFRRLATQGRVTRMSSSAAYAMGRMIRYAGIVVGVLIALRVLGIELTNLVIFGGALGIGIGIGLQNIFNNFLSGLVLLFEKSLRVGDFVELESGLVGRVAEIDMRYTRITTNDLVDVIVPNSQFTENRVTNWSYGETIRRIHVPFGVTYTARKEDVREAGIAAARRVKGTVLVDGRLPDVWLVDFGDSSLDFELIVWVGNELLTAPGRASALYLWAIHDELAARGIEIPYPQRDLHVRSGTLQVRIDDGRELPSMVSSS